MSVKKKLLTSTIIMLVIPAVLILLLSALLVGIFNLLNPELEATVLNGVHFSNTHIIRFIIIWACMVAAIIIITGICITSYINHAIVKPLQNLYDGLEHIKNGDLSYEFIGSDDEEIRELCSSFEELRLQLQKNVRMELKKENEHRMLLANISHDIKTPVTSIKGYVDGIKDGIADTPEKQEHYLRTIYAKAELIEQMAENLSIFSKLELGRLQYDRKKTDIFLYLTEITDKFRLDLQTAEMDFSVSVPQESAYVLADTEKLGRVFANIISNAIKYKKPGNGKLSVIAEVTDNGVLITFSDSGKGIAEADIPHIFDGFYRGDKSRNANIEGNGLGLSISRRIVNDHGGKIWIRSQKDIHTDVIILLPIMK